LHYRDHVTGCDHFLPRLDECRRRRRPLVRRRGPDPPAGRERRHEVDEAQLARAVAQLSAVGATWDARLRRIKRIAEAIQRDQRS
jgi:hypothetical protein